MTTWRRLWPLLLNAALCHAAFGAARPAMSYRAIELGAGGATMGLLSASFSIVPLLLAFPAGRYADRVGARPLVIAGTVGFALAGALGGLAGGLPVLLVASALLGFGQLVTIVGQQAAIALATAGAAREGASDSDRAFGALTAMASLGQIVGPIIGTAALRHDQRLIGVGGSTIVALTAFAVAIVVQRRRPADAPTPERRPWHRDAAQVLGVPGMWATLATGGLVIAALDLLVTFLPLWAEERGVAPATVGALLSTRAAVTLALRLGVDRLVDLLGRPVTIVGSLLIGALGLALLPLAGARTAFAVMVLLGIGLGAAQPLTMAWVADMAVPGTQGAAVGLRLTANRLSQATVPAGVGLAAASAGAAGVFVGTGVLLALGAGALVWYGRAGP